MVGEKNEERKSMIFVVVKNIKSDVQTSLLAQNKVWTLNHNIKGNSL